MQAFWSGEWRRVHLASQEGSAMFIDLLVAVAEGTSSLHGLELGLKIAQAERAIVHGSHTVSSPDQIDAEDVTALRVAFNRKCHTAGIPGRLAVEVGNLAAAVWERARWSDLVVLERSADEAIVHDIIQHVSRPVLFRARRARQAGPPRLRRQSKSQGSAL
jgi:hypothetical protein